MTRQLSKSTYVLLASSSLAICALRIVQWRARKRAKSVADQAQQLVADGPMIDCADEAVGRLMLQSAVKRAKQWISNKKVKPTPMVGQVGGLSSNHKPMLILEPNCVLKPMQSNNRGLREVAFYEAMKLASQSGVSPYDILVSTCGRKPTKSGQKIEGRGVIENCDLVAMWLALILQDPVVADSESRLSSCGKRMKREIELLRRLSNFTAPYYGVVENFLEQPSKGESDYHILMQDIRANFVKPCVVDIKMGTQTYEPDASMEKRKKERSKYEQQSIFGMRIVGMRRYDPNNPYADDSGFVTEDKNYGRSLTTREGLLEAFRNFFTSTVNGNRVVRTQSIANILMLLQLLRRWFDENNCLCFYSSSILLVYEGSTEGSGKHLTNMKMVDFGHVRREPGGDHGYILGLRTLCSLFKDLLPARA